MITQDSKRSLSHPVGGSDFIAWVIRDNRLTPTSDRMQQGWVALLKCAKLRDVNRGSLSTYAYRAVKHAAYSAHGRRRDMARSTLIKCLDWQRVVADIRCPEEPCRAAERAELIAEVRKSLAALGERDALILRLRFGLDGSGGMTLEECGRELGITKERVRQLEMRALRRIWQLHAHILGEFVEGQENG
jgi:RNA polymerase sigma factor (sigma-70 family)